jgi:hypothetical protein
MSYYIRKNEYANVGDMVIYSVVKRLRDFKADDGVEYMVFPSKKKMKTAIFVDLYIGKNGKLVKLKDRSMMRF